MQNWTSEIWTVIVLAFVFGAFLSYALLRLTKGGKHQVELEKELKTVKAQQEVQTTQLESHFSESATLLATLATDYKKLYTHLANSSEKLLPESHSQELFQQLQLEEQKTEQKVKETVKDAKEEVKKEVKEKEQAVTSDEKSAKEAPQEKTRPRDYPDKPTGLFKGEEKK